MKSFKRNIKVWKCFQVNIKKGSKGTILLLPKVEWGMDLLWGAVTVK
jgi:hypothetical protein